MANKFKKNINLSHDTGRYSSSDFRLNNKNNNFSDYSYQMKVLFSFPGICASILSCAICYSIYRIAHYEYDSFLITLTMPVTLVILFCIFYGVISSCGKYKFIVFIVALIPSLYFVCYAYDYYTVYSAKQKIKKEEARKLEENPICKPLKDGYELCEEKLNMRGNINKCELAFHKLMGITGFSDYIWITGIQRIKSSTYPNAKYAIVYIKEEDNSFRKIPGSEKTLILNSSLDGITVIDGALFK